MSSTLEPGRLALRKPELGGFLMVEVELLENTDKGSLLIVGDGEYEWHFDAGDFIPVLRPGDVVPPGSLLLDVNTGNHLTMWEANADMEPVDMQGAIYEATMFALLRYGPEDAADGETPHETVGNANDVQEQDANARLNHAERALEPHDEPAECSAEDQQFAIRFPEKVGTIGTHYPGCYHSHPSCAWRVGWNDGYESTRNDQYNE